MKNWKAIFMSVVISTVLAVGFGILYFNDHAWGAWGDDSAGYIYLAGRLFSGDPLVYKDELGAKGLDFFDDETLARWLLPTHHQFINTHGMVASKYPIGVSLLMYLGAKIVSSSTGFYFVNPLLAVANLVLLYLFALLLFPHHRFRHVIGFFSASALGLCSMYYDFAIAQPMREIPSITFLLLSSIVFVLALQYRKQRESIRSYRWWSMIALFTLSGMSFGIAVDIRETSIVVLPAFVGLGSGLLWRQGKSLRANVQHLLLPMSIFIISFLIGLIPLIVNSVRISQDKEVFKKRDVSAVVVLPNIGHIETISFKNIFHSVGKFKTDEDGSLPHFWVTMQNAVPIPYFLAFVLLGMCYVWKESRSIAVFLVFWCIGILLIFSLWINPYSRYILPMYPPLLLLGMYGGVAFFTQFLPRIIKKRGLIVLLGFAVFGTIILAYQPVIARVHTSLYSDVYLFKSISRSDLNTLMQLGDKMKSLKNPVLMFSGKWQYGTSETFEAHTGVKTIHFPFEQKKFIFNTQKVYAFIDEMLQDGYTINVWVDSTSSAAVSHFLEQYDTAVFATESFTFQPGVSIISIQKREK